MAAAKASANQKRALVRHNFAICERRIGVERAQIVDELLKMRVVCRQKLAPVVVAATAAAAIIAVAMRRFLVDFEFAPQR